MQHMWARFHRQRQLEGPLLTRGSNSSSARRGRKLAIENTVTLLGTDGKRVPEMFPKEIAAPSVSVDPVVWHQYAATRNGGLATKTTEISVLQSGGIPTLPASLGTSSVLNNTAASEIDGSQSAVGAEVEKPGTATMSPNTSSRTSWKKTRSKSAKPQEDAPLRAVHAVTSLENCIFFCSLSHFFFRPPSPPVFFLMCK